MRRSISNISIVTALSLAVTGTIIVLLWWGSLAVLVYKLWTGQV